jgi:O-antigen ligase
MDYMTRLYWLPLAIIFYLIPCITIIIFVDPFVETKWLTFNFSAGLLGYFVAQKARIISIKLSPFLVITATVLILLFLASLATNPQFILSQLSDWTAWLILTLAIAVNTSKIQSGLRERLFFATLATILAFFILSSTKIGPDIWDFPFFTMGYQNFSGHLFAVIGIFFVTQFLEVASFLRQHFRLLIIAACVIILGLLKSRAAIGGYICATTVVAAISAFAQNFSYKKKYLQIAILTLVLPVIYDYSLHNGDTQTTATLGASVNSNPSELKELNFDHRLRRWKKTLTLIKQYPLLGVGPGNFEFMYPTTLSIGDGDNELNEGDTLRSPHNGFLEITTEVGIPALLAFLIILAFVFKDLFLRARNEPQARFALGLLVFLLFDAMFAFPLELPFTFAVSAFIFGTWLNAFTHANNSRLPPAVVAVLSTLLLLTTTIRAHSIWTESVVNDPVKLEASCRIYPDNWNTCVKAMWLYRKNGHAQDSLSLANQMLRWQPNGEAFVRERLLSLSKLGEFERMCADLGNYCAPYGSNCQFWSYCHP